MKRVTPLVHMWSRYSPADRLDHNGYFVQRSERERGTLVDPVAPNEGDREEMVGLGGVATVVLTGGDEKRGREAARLQGELGGAVYAPVEAVGALKEAGVTEVRGFQESEELPGGLTPIVLGQEDAAGGGKRWVFFHRGARAWLVGERIEGVPAGALGLPGAIQDEALKAREARGLRGLLAVMFERVLVGRGMPVLREAERAVQDLVYAHDPEACVMRQSEASYAPGLQHGTTYGRRGAEYARLLGLNTLEFDLQEVQPGRRSTAVHRHDGDEECFVIVSGEGELHILRPGESEVRRIPVSAGDVVGFPPRYQIAHSFKCTGDEPLRFFAFGSRGEESVAVVDYPLSGKRLTYARPPGKQARYYLPERRDVPYFENEPDS